MKGAIGINIWSDLSRFYSLPLAQVLCIMLCLIVIWTVIPVFSKCKIYRWWEKFNILSFTFSLLLIIKMTLWDRSVGFREVELRPFYTFTTISYNNEALRTLLMNVILFLPFGLTIPYVAEAIKIRKNKFRWI